MNFLEGSYEQGEFILKNGVHIQMPEMHQKKLAEYTGKELILGIRPEDIYVEDIVKETYPSAVFDFKIDVTEMLGHEYILYGTIGDQELTLRTSLRVMAKQVSNLEIAFDLSKCHVFDKISERSILL